MTKSPVEADFGARAKGKGFKKVETSKSFSFRVLKFIFYYVGSKKQLASKAESVCLHP